MFTVKLNGWHKESFRDRDTTCVCWVAPVQESQLDERVDHIACPECQTPVGVWRPLFKNEAVSETVPGTVVVDCIHCHEPLVLRVRS